MFPKSGRHTVRWNAIVSGSERRGTVSWKAWTRVPVHREHTKEEAAIKCYGEFKGNHNWDINTPISGNDSLSDETEAGSSESGRGQNEAGKYRSWLYNHCIKKFVVVAQLVKKQLLCCS